MEQKKDITTYKTGIEILEGKSPQVNKKHSLRDEQSLAQFGFDVFLNKKTKKLTTALYMVTSFLSDNEPIKWKLRERGVALLSGIFNVRNKNVSEVENVFSEFCVSVDEINSLLEVAAASKLISEMNFSILKKEYILLKSLMETDKYKEEKTGRILFSDGFFADEKEIPKPRNMNIQRGHDSEKDLFLSKTDGDDTKEINKGHYFTKRQNTKRHLIKKRENVAIKETKANRRESILKLFKKKGKELMIKDITREVSGCSEKTIQRELMALVEQSVLKKRGERRWSRYSLK
jgi:hypothetical protein